MDQFYFEQDGYFESKYFVYTADAVIDLSPYVTDTYYANDYFQYTGILSSLTAELTELVGQDVFADAYLTSAATISINAGVIFSAGSTMSVEFAQTASISHIEGADLFAFSEAQIAVQVDRLRDNNIETSTAFSVSAEVARIRNIDSEEQALFTAIINGLRSRDFNSETQAAFSFAAELDIVKEYQSSLESTTSISVDADVVRDLSAALDSQSQLSADVGVIKPADADLNSETTVSATISHIEGADLLAFTNASLTVDFIRIQSSQASLTSALSTSVDAEHFKGIIKDLSSSFALGIQYRLPTKGGAANLQAVASIYTSPKFGSRRPVYLASRYGNIDSTRSKGGSNSLTLLKGIDAFAISSNSLGVAQGRAELTVQANENFIFETWFYLPANTAPAFSRESVIAGLGFGASSSTGSLSLTSLTSYSYETEAWALGLDFPGRLKAKYTKSDATVGTITTTTSLVEDAWNHIGLRRINGNTIQIIFNNSVVGSSTYSGALNPVGLQSGNNNYKKFWIAHTLNSSQAQPVWFDELNYRVGSGNIAIYDSQPIVGDPATQQLLHHFESSYVSPDTPALDIFTDDTGFVITYNAALTAFSGFGFNGGLLTQASANLSSNASVVANAVRPIFFDVNLESNTNISVDNQRTRDIQSSIASESSLIVDLTKLNGGSSNLSSDTTLSADNLRVRFASADMSAQGFEVIVADKIKNAQANISTAFVTEKSYIDLDYIQSGYYESIAIEATKIADAEIQTQAISTELAAVAKIADFFVNADLFTALSAEVQVSKEYSSNISVDSQISVDADKIADIAKNLENNATLTANAYKILQFAVDLSIAFTSQCDAIKTGTNSVICSSEFAVSVDVDRLAGLDSNIASEFVQTASADRFRSSDVSLTDQIAVQAQGNVVFDQEVSSQIISTVSCIISHIEGADIVAENFATMSVVAETGLFGSATLSSNLTANINVDKITGYQADLHSQASVSGSLSKIQQAASDLDLTAVISSNINYISYVTAGISSASTLTATISHIEGADIVAENFATLTAQAQIAVDADAVISSQSAVSVTGLRIKSLSATVNVSAGQTTQAVKSASALVSVNSQFQVTANVVRIKQLAATISSALNFVANVREIDADSINQNVWTIQRELWTYKVLEEVRNQDEILYVIPSESWTWNIASEDWLEIIPQETRTYIIKED